MTKQQTEWVVESTIQEFFKDLEALLDQVRYHQTRATLELGGDTAAQALTELCNTELNKIELRKLALRNEEAA